MDVGTIGESEKGVLRSVSRMDAVTLVSSRARSILVSAITARVTPRYVRIFRCSSVCGIQPSSAATIKSAKSIEPTPGNHILYKVFVPRDVDDSQ